MKKTLILLLLIMFGGALMSPQQDVSTTLSFDVNAATNYLRIRPGSDKSNNDLTRTQLLAFLDVVTDEVNTALTGLYDIDRTLVQDRLATLTALLDGLDDATFNNDKEFYYSLYEGLFELYSYTLESRTVEGRGMWHRPFESNLAEVRETLAELQAMGVNMLYVETFWMGRLIYDSNVPGTFQHGFTLGGYADGSVDYGTNLLVAFVEEGKNYGIEVHAWVENFFVGYGDSYTSSPILNQNPDWASFNYDGTIPQKQEINYLFMDPANPETRDYLKAIYGEMALFDDVASIHLDYIRYPVAANVTSTTSNRDTGYSVYAEREFKSIYGYTGDLRTLVVTNPQAAADWREYKTQVISDFVAGVYYTVKNLNPDIYLSTAIFGNLNHALETKMQDWASWIEDGYVELILPMAYYQSSITVRSEVGNLTTIVDSNAFSYAGIAPSFMGYNDHLNTTQIEGSLDGNAMGATFFASQNYLIETFNGTITYNTKVQSILTNGTFRNAAMVPHGDTQTVVTTIFDDILDKADRLYVPHGKMTSQQRADLEAALLPLRSMSMQAEQDLYDLIAALEAINVATHATDVAVNRIQDDIDYLIDILVIKAKRLHFDNTIDISVNPDPNTTFPDPIELDAPTNLTKDGATVSWDEVPNAVGYLVNLNGTTYMTAETFFDVRDGSVIGGTNIIGVIAMGDDVVYTDSDYSVVLQFEALELDAPSGIHIIDDVLYFDPVEGAVEYYLKVGIKTRRFTATEFDLSTLNLTTDIHEIELRAIGDGYQSVDSDFSDETEYKAGDLSLQAIFGDLFTSFATSSLNQNQEEE